MENLKKDLTIIFSEFEGHLHKKISSSIFYFENEFPGQTINFSLPRKYILDNITSRNNINIVHVDIIGYMVIWIK